MSLAKLINRSCTISRREPSDAEDEYGNEIPGVTLIDTICELQQRQRSEPGDEDETSDSTWTLFLLPSDALGTGDVVIVAGERYEVTGEPWPARNPRTGVVEHIEATVRRVAGAMDEPA